VHTPSSVVQYPAYARRVSTTGSRVGGVLDFTEGNSMPKQAPLPTRAGIYEIRNRDNGHFYVGSAGNLSKRWRDHRDKLRKGTHANPHLQAAWVLYGERAFEFVVLELVAANGQMLMDAEQRWLDSTRAAYRSDCYNILPNAWNALGVKRSDATKARIAEAARGRTPSLEAREKMRRAKLGKKWSPESRAKVSATRTGRRLGPRPDAWKSQFRKLTPEQVKELWDLRRDGWHITGLVSHFGISPSTVGRILRRESYVGVGEG
jgi:group I intron endonuclease